MKKAFAAFVAVLLLCLLAGLGQTRNQPRTNENKVRPEITHEFVEQLVEEWRYDNLYEVLTNYDFNTQELHLIKTYLQENQDGWSDNFNQSLIWEDNRDALIQNINDILGELQYDQIFEGEAIAVAYYGPSYLDGYLLLLKLPCGREEWISINYASTLLDSRLDTIDPSCTSIPLKIYVKQYNEKLWDAIKIEVTNRTQFDDSVANYEHDWRAGLVHYEPDNDGKLQVVHFFDVTVLAFKDHGPTVGVDLSVKFPDGHKETVYLDYQLTYFNDEWIIPEIHQGVFKMQAIRDTGRWRVVYIIPRENLIATRQSFNDQSISEEQKNQLREQARQSAD